MLFFLFTKFGLMSRVGSWVRHPKCRTKIYYKLSTMGLSSAQEKSLDLYCKAKTDSFLVNGTVHLFTHIDAFDRKDVMKLYELADLPMSSNGSFFISMFKIISWPDLKNYVKKRHYFSFWTKLISANWRKSTRKNFWSNIQITEQKPEADVSSTYICKIIWRSASFNSFRKRKSCLCMPHT